MTRRPAAHISLFSLLSLVAQACGDEGRDTAGVSDSQATQVTSLGTSSTTEGPATTTSGSTSDVTTEPTTGAPVTSTSTPTEGTTAVETTTEDPVSTTTVSTTDSTTGPPIDMCKVHDNMDAIGDCSQKAPPDSFDPEIQWTWTGPNGDLYSIVTPLVANLTDDNGDGEIDLCDVPDIVVVASPAYGSPNQAGRIYVLDGATGAQHHVFSTPVDHTVTPALGDIDGDGVPEIVSAILGGNPIAFEHDGTVKWTSASNWPDAYSGAIALGDVDNDGDVEILAGNRLFDHLGNLLITLPAVAGNWSASALADLDGDGDLEIVLGHAAYHHTGEAHYVTNIGPGYPSIANLDGDPEPEVLVTNQTGITLLDHDGTVQYQDQRPTGDIPQNTTWLRPSTVHDFDGDGKAEFAVSSANNYTVYRPAGPTIVWKAPVSDQSGIAAGTAFDFLGDGVAEAMYADEFNMYIFGGVGEVLLQIPRTSGTLSEYPVVADIDNDGSAEIVVVSSYYQSASPTVQVIRDKQDRWIQARRIWNQHTYHVTNVREDGTIPQFEAPSWKALNTYRTNSQIENGGLCQPPIPG